MMSDIALRLDNIHVAYDAGQHRVLNGFSLALNRGELTCLLGASGDFHLVGALTASRQAVRNRGLNLINHPVRFAIVNFTRCGRCW
jgi:ABC-type histidine transport system ATPase subunit